MLLFAEISSDLDARGNKKDPFQIRKSVTKILVNLGMVPVLPKLSNFSPPEYLTVMLDGCVIGHVSTVTIPSVIDHLRRLKVVDGSEVRDWQCHYLEVFVKNALLGNERKLNLDLNAGSSRHGGSLYSMHISRVISWIVSCHHTVAFYTKCEAVIW